MGLSGPATSSAHRHDRLVEASPGLTSRPHPPFINTANLALVAIGLLTVSMISMFGWREDRNTRRSAQGNAANPWESPTPAHMDHARRGDQPPGLSSANAVPVRSRRRHRQMAMTLGEKPKLWDVQIQVPGTENHKQMPLCWDEIMPVAATMAKEEEQHPSLIIPISSNPPRRWIGRRLSRPLRWLCCCGRRVEPEKQQFAAADMGCLRKELQVAVAIAMPCRPYKVLPDWYFPNIDPALWDRWEAGYESYVGLDYSIGVYKCPWDEKV